MARIVPYEIDAAAKRGQAARELETLERLEVELPDEFTVYHGVHWTHADQKAALYGEIDFIVANRLGRLIAIEQKNGPVEIGATDLLKRYPDGPRGLRAQVGRNLKHLMTAFGRRFPGRLDIDHLLYLPDHELVGRLPSSVDPDRVVDARSAARLALRLQAMFDERPAPSPSADTGGGEPPDPVDVHVFLSDLAEAVPSVDAIGRLARTHYRRLSGGLATWAQRLELDPFRLRVVGTAGSGKTQLALAELHAAHAAGRAALYVCFNRALADAMRAAAPASESCTTFHELAAWVTRTAGRTIDYAQPGVFDLLARTLIDASTAMAGSVDLLVVDEGQDFAPEWADALVRLVRDGGRVLWLEDPSQNLYRRPAVPLPGWAVLRSPVNHRSPHVVVALVNALGLVDPPMQAGGAVHGFDPVLREYSDTQSLLDQTDAAVGDLVKEGHAPADIAVIAWHGLAHSRVAGLDRIAGLPTRRFTGDYTNDGRAVMSEGVLQLETLHRFKGQAADCVVITEIDFDAWTEDACRRLFVGLTRARLKVTLVASGAAAGLIGERLA